MNGASDAAVPTPIVCPFCGSSKIKTTSEAADANGYWRCETCGDVWNAGRLKALKRYGDDMRFGSRR